METPVDTPVDVNNNSASPNDEENDYKHKRRNLMINVTQPIMAYQSQTKTDKSYKDEYNINNVGNNGDTG